jgi:hypothetical protein
MLRFKIKLLKVGCVSHILKLLTKIVSFYAKFRVYLLRLFQE